MSKASKAFIELFGINSILLFFDTPHLLWSNSGISYNTVLCKSVCICLEHCCYNHVFILFLVFVTAVPNSQGSVTAKMLVSVFTANVCKDVLNLFHV